MEIQVETDEGITIITIGSVGLDAKDAPIFKQKMIDLINQSDAKYVVFDLKNLKFIDSSGLGSFLSILRVLNAKKGDLKLACMNETVRTMFELVSMHKIFEIYNNTLDAVRSYASVKTK